MSEAMFRAVLDTKQDTESGRIVMQTPLDDALSGQDLIVQLTPACTQHLAEAHRGCRFGRGEEQPKKAQPRGSVVEC